MITNAPTEQRTWHIDLGGGVSMTFCYIPPCLEGFWMGSRDGYPNEQPVHRVVIPDGFWMGQTPVTQRQFAAFRPEHNSHFAGRPNNPVENVNWNDAVAFCVWLTVNFYGEFPDNFIADLPTEAHWEYACRAGSHTDFYSGDGMGALVRVGANGERWGTGSTHRVADLSANDWRLFDMHGNVWEWCKDPWDELAYRRRWDGISAKKTSLLAERFADKSDRVLRGGSWIDTFDWCRTTFRGRGRAVGGDSVGDFGLRACLFSLDQKILVS